MESSSKGHATTERTTTYGYLTDDQFEFAYQRVKAAIQGHSSEKKRLLHQNVQLRHKLDRAKRLFARFKKHLECVDRQTEQKIKPAHAFKLVGYHALNHTEPWET